MLAMRTLNFEEGGEQGAQGAGVLRGYGKGSGADSVGKFGSHADGHRDEQDGGQAAADGGEHVDVLSAADHGDAHDDNRTMHTGQRVRRGTGETISRICSCVGRGWWHWRCWWCWSERVMVIRVVAMALIIL